MADLADKGKKDNQKHTHSPEAAPIEVFAPQEDLSLSLGAAKPDASSPVDPKNITPKTIIQMQRVIGNQAVQRLLTSDKAARHDKSEVDDVPHSVKPLTVGALNLEHPVAASLNRPDVRFRVPEFDRIKAAYLDKDLKIPEAVIKDRLAKLLGRMKFEKRLKSKDDIPTIISKIFPAPSKIDETEFENAVDTSDRSKVYKDVFDANTTVKPPDKAKLKAAIQDSIDLIKKAEANAAGLTAVFGTKDALAKGNYVKARGSLDTIAKDLDTHVTTDYNLDDPEVGLGGWANFSSQHMHLLLSVAKVTDPDDTKITLIHEASHLADPSVDDLGYYGSTGFEAMTEDEKVGNAAHYEELPARELGKSKFAGATFTPGVKKGGGVVTREDRVRRLVSEHLRKAWDAAVDTHTFIRELRQVYLKGNKAAFTTHKVIIMEISNLTDMTVHTQAAGKEIITTIDVTISESMARGMVVLQEAAEKVPFPAPGALTDLELRDKIVAEAAKNYGNLLGDAARDKKLIDWFVAHYRSIPSV